MMLASGIGGVIVLRPRLGGGKPGTDGTFPCDFSEWGICLTQVARVLRSHVRWAPEPARRPLPPLAQAGRGVVPRGDPRSRGTAPPGCCQSDYLSEADSHLQRFLPVISSWFLRSRRVAGRALMMQIAPPRSAYMTASKRRT